MSVTTAPAFNIGKVMVILEGDVVISAVGGITEAFEDESVYGKKPPLMVYTTLRELH